MRGIVRLAVAQARQDRWVLAVWIAGAGLLGYAMAAAVGTAFGGEPERAMIVMVAAGSPAFLFLRGLPDGTGLGEVVFFQGFSFTAVLAGLMSTFLVVRHTRHDEELGRSELFGTAPISRSAPLSATLMVGVAANTALAMVLAAGFAAGGLPAPGSVTAGLAVGAVGVFFVAAAAAVSQLMPSGRGANGVSAALVGLAYLVRGIGDALGSASDDFLHVTPAWPSLLSPIGWGQRARPFTEPDPVPLLVLASAAAVLGTGVVFLRERRDLGASLLAAGVGKERAGVAGQSLFGLAWRLQRGTLAGWSAGAAVMGAIAGGLGPMVGQVAEGNPSLGDLIGQLVPGSQLDIVDVFTAALLGMAGVLAAGAGVQATLRLRAEEDEGRAEILLATPRSKARWLGATLAVAGISVLAVSAITGAAAALGLGLTEAGSHPAVLILLAAVAHVPAALVFVALTALAFALLPRLAAALGWSLLAAGLVLGEFGEMFRLPGWIQELSPFRHSSAMPVEAFNGTGALLMAAVSVAGAGLAAYLLGRRDLTS
ncbi:polyketide antibiotic transporter [Arthrobacter sp. SPG23]|uniref:ABC transporter permease n=1 Tax=Arthrobacter sp. SPG23 TaxID=1610703 RepID=UPI0005BB7E96|nr:polyketide antibiotic transporter [Arthrobacter sp. SPG23]KIS29230.1 polyketide antibiotic transporter [Arthrobacter sp. SPG23]